MVQLFIIIGTLGAILLAGSIVGIIVFHKQKLKRWQQHMQL